jgi:hypothetical protein
LSIPAKIFGINNNITVFANRIHCILSYDENIDACIAKLELIAIWW